MSIVQEMSSLANELRQLESTIRVQFDPLPSGVTYLNIGVKHKSFVMGYYPRHGGIGVDEVLDGEGFEEGYRHWFTDFAAAKEKLLEMVNAARTES